MFLLVCLFALVLNPLVSNSTSVDYGEWKLIKNNNGVQTFVRWNKSAEGLEYRERKGEMNVNCSRQKVVQLLSDAGSTKKWMSGIDETYFISHISLTEWYTYTLFNIPWPFDKRDLVSQNVLTEDATKGITRIVIVCKATYIPLKPGIMRLTDYRATWIISKIDEKSTRITFSATSSAPPVFPKAIQDPVIERIFHNNLVRLREKLSS